MQQCFNALIDIYHEFLLLFYCCVLLEIKLTTTTTTTTTTAAAATATATATAITATAITTATTTTTTTTMIKDWSTFRRYLRSDGSIHFIHVLRRWRFNHRCKFDATRTYQEVCKEYKYLQFHPQTFLNVITHPCPNLNSGLVIA